MRERIELPDAVASELAGSEDEVLKALEEHLDCRVYLRPDCAVGDQPLFNGLILLDPELSNSLNRRAQDISVWGHHSLKDVLEQRELREQVRRETAQAGWLLVTPDDFFTRELALLAHDGRVEGHGAYGAFADAVLPLSPLAVVRSGSPNRAVSKAPASSRARWRNDRSRRSRAP